MATATAMQFQRKFGEYEHKARREPVEITRHGRREFVFISAEHYDSLAAKAGRAHRTADAPASIVEAVRKAKMDKRHERLNKLMK